MDFRATKEYLGYPVLTKSRNYSSCYHSLMSDHVLSRLTLYEMEVGSVYPEIAKRESWVQLMFYGKLCRTYCHCAHRQICGTLLVMLNVRSPSPLCTCPTNWKHQCLLQGYSTAQCIYKKKQMLWAPKFIYCSGPLDFVVAVGKRKRQNRSESFS